VTKVVVEPERPSGRRQRTALAAREKAKRREHTTD